MAITPSDFNVIWGSNASTPDYNFSSDNYQTGWDFVGNLPPTRGMWNALQKRTDEKMQYMLLNLGHPFVASTASDMTDTDKVYVYVGSEVGYTNGDWYYYDTGTSSWVSGGVYNSTAVVTDTTLSLAGEPADAEATGDAIKEVDTEMSLFGVQDLLWNYTFDGSSRTSATVVYSVDKDAKTATINGTATGSISTYRFYNNTSSLPTGMVAGGTYIAELDTDLDCKLQVYPYIGGTLGGILCSTSKQKLFTIPANATGALIRLYMANGSTVNGTVRPLIADVMSLRGMFDDGGFINRSILPTNSDLNDIKTTGLYYLSSAYTYSNVALANTAGFLTTYNDTSAGFTLQIANYIGKKRTYVRSCNNGTWSSWQTITNNALLLPNNTDLDTLSDTDNWLLDASFTYTNPPASGSAFLLSTYKVEAGSTLLIQIAYGYSVNDFIYRRSKTGANPWSDWEVIGGGGGTTYNNTYEFNEYTSTNTITVTPTITTDNHNYLASSGDSTDRKGDIEALLSTNGICHLAPGDFYVSGVDMEEYSKLMGCGNSTRVILLGSDTDEGYAIKMATGCTVQDMMVMGNTTDNTSNSAVYPVNATYTQRHGILWQGNASGDNDDIPRRGTINNCYICNFTGGGITGYDSGMNVNSGMNVSDCTIWYCYAGINLQYLTEFSRFTNVASNNCLYGCIDNGGNQMFVNCGFSNNRTGILLDDSTGQSPNNSHGSFVGCTINHSGSNTGYAIKMYGLDSGQVFSACQVFYGKTLIDNCKGVRFIGQNMGRQTGIEITNSSAITFDSCQFRTATDTPVTSSGNTGVYFNNCLLYNGSSYYPV